MLAFKGKPQWQANERDEYTVDHSRQVYIVGLQVRLDRFVASQNQRSSFRNSCVGANGVNSSVLGIYGVKSRNLTVPRRHIALMERELGFGILLLQLFDRVPAGGDVDVEDGNVSARPWVLLRLRLSNR